MFCSIAEDFKWKAFFFLANGPDRNDIPEPSKRRGNPFWSFMGGTLGLPAERFEPIHTEGVSPKIAEIREYERRRAEANAPPGPPSIAADIVSEVADVVTTAAKKVAKLSKLEQAMTWLREVLNSGPQTEKAIQAMARKADIETGANGE